MRPFVLSAWIAVWLLLGVAPVLAQSGEVVRQIRVQGNERIEAATVESYLTIKPGDRADPAALEKPGIADAATPIVPRRDWRLWTDDFNNLVQVLK